MTSSEDGSDFDDLELLLPEESLDDDELGLDPEETYSPVERPVGVFAWGTTGWEAARHEDLDHRLAREEPELGADDGDGIGDSTDTDGEPLDDQVGDRRTGRLVIAQIDELDARSDYWAEDVGIDGAGASAEEAAIHTVPLDAESRIDYDGSDEQ